MGDFIHRERCFSFLLLCCFVATFLLRGEKQKLKPSLIVGLMAVRNESGILAQHLRAFSLYTDAIVVLDDASTDDTVVVIESLARECNIQKIIRKKVWHRDEPGDKNKLLEAGRELGGTHFIVMDADEMFTANCLENNFLRKKILELNPGDKLCMTLINLWRSADYYRYDASLWSGIQGDFVFCDDGQCSYISNFIHTSRTPNNLTGKVIMLETDHFALPGALKASDIMTGPRFTSDEINYAQRYLNYRYLYPKQENGSLIDEFKILFAAGGPSVACYRADYTLGVLHFQFVNWENLLIKQAWYRCLEKIRDSDVRVEQINEKYGYSKNEEDLRLRPVPENWFEGYSFFDKNLYLDVVSWQKKQVLQWFDQYGTQYFEDLDIWDIDWTE